ncbi:MAG: DUF3823 domain-containing protein [Chitinophagaceae bacterium]|nr:DUF3823 domain-containing protein [Chitinophagaceae bacterium]
MKNLFYICCVVLSLTGCKVDNYEGPNAVISGKIIDNETKDLVPSGGSVSGTIVRFYQNNATQPLNFTTFPDGTFTNKASFTGSYTYTAEGPFTLVNSAPQSVTVTSQTEVDVPVVPNIRLSAQQTQTGGSTATYKVSYEKLTNDQDMIEIGISWADYKNPNRIVYAGGKNLLENVAGQGLVSGDEDFEITGLESGKIYYIRAFARTNNPGGYYNYSQQVELHIP